MSRASYATVLDRPSDGFVQGFLPPACAMCTRGTKLVVFVTGKCHYQCYYCPVGETRRNVDRMWANETPLEPGDLDGLVTEAHRMGAMGAGLTGGDPLYAPERAVAIVRHLKAEFGPGFHIHLYTNIVFDPAWLPELAAAGLDEIRFHPPPFEWDAMDRSPRAPLIRAAKATGMSTGLEVPCPPDHEPQLASLIAWALANGVDHVNLNELEFAAPNADALLARGYESLNETTMRVRGSREVATRLVARFAGKPVTIHFCTSPFKDAVQLKNRLLRLAQRVAKAHDVATEEGTLLRGLVAGSPAHLRNRLRRLGRRQPAGQHREGLLVSPAVATELASILDDPVFLVETYPTVPELEVERIPLNRAAHERVGTASPSVALSRFP